MRSSRDTEPPYRQTTPANATGRVGRIWHGGTVPCDRDARFRMVQGELPRATGQPTWIGLALSCTRVRRLDAAGASKIGTLLLYFLIACIGMQMDLPALADKPWLFALGIIWISVHIIVLWLFGKLLRVRSFISRWARRATSAARHRRLWSHRCSIPHWRQSMHCLARSAMRTARCSPTS